LIDRAAGVLSRNGNDAERGSRGAARERREMA
jgi:hypothetical protein